MKKILLASAVALLAAGAQAQDASELRIYINPGHGSWTPNDRPNPLVDHDAYSRTNTDTLNFFESNTNLRKGFGLMERLIDYGLKFDRTLNQTGERWQIGAARDMSNNIVMSHVKCGPFHDDNGTKNQLGDKTPADIYYYNRNLSEICQEVEANNFDMFISIHSNASEDGTTTNYPLVLYRGYDSPKQEAGLDLSHQTTSREMADAIWGYAMGNTHSKWTYYSMTNKNIRGDINFYGSNSTVNGFKGYLGVLKHGAPGFLVEGYFHTYQPARHRAMNWDVCALEGTAYARGIADYFGLETEKTGTIYGIVRDQHEKFTHKYYKPNPATDDVFKPLNGVTVVLRKDGKEVATYTTDNYYNGAFVFNKLEPGTYTIECSHADYKAPKAVEVEVKANADVYPSVFMESNDYEAPAIEYVDYPDPLAGNAAVNPADSYNFEASYTDEPIAGLEGKTLRRAVAHNGLVYILAVDGAEKPAPTIVVYDPAAKKVVANVSTEGTYGTVMNVSDIQVSADGYLLACNKTKNQYSADYIEKGDEGRGTFYIYKWENDANGLPTGDPEKWMSTQQSGRWFRSYAGTTFAYSGTVENGKAIIAQPTITAPNHGLRMSLITVTNGANAGCADILAPGVLGEDNKFTATNESDLGSDYRFVASPVTDNFYIVGSKHPAVEYKFLHEDKTGALSASSDEFNALRAVGNSGMFRYAGASYMVVPAVEGDNNTGLTLVNISDNIAGAKVVSTANTAIEAAANANTAAMGEVTVTRDPLTEAITEYWINLYLLRDGKMSTFTTRKVEQPKSRNEYAYGLKAERNADAYDVTFSMTGAVPEASLVLSAEDAEDIVIGLGALEKGENKVVVDATELNPGKDYSWCINVKNAPIATASEYSADNNDLQVRGGVIVITDPAQESFGYAAVGHGKNNGYDIYNPEGEKVATRIWKGHSTMGGSSNTNQSDPIRGAQRQGKAVFAGWGDKSHGAVAVDLLNHDSEPFTLFLGDKTTSGCHQYNGINLGGGCSGLTFVGDYMYSFSEDHENMNGSGSTENQMVRYHVGTGWEIAEAPEMLGYKSTLANTNVELEAYGDGYFAAQVRGAGNNISSTPSFIYVDANENAVTFNSAEVADNLNESSSGIAITPDGNTLAVATNSSIAIFDVEWDGTTPTLTYKYDIPMGGKTVWSQMKFDYAGNLHTYIRDMGGYHVYTLPSKGREVSTPAAAIYSMQNSSAVNNVAVDTDNAPVVFYNIQGVRVNGDNLTPGVYVKVQGKKATKVVVK